MFKEMETVEVAKTTITGVFELVKRALLKSRNPFVVLLAQKTVDSIFGFVGVVTDEDKSAFQQMEEVTKTELKAMVEQVGKEMEKQDNE